MLEAKSLFAAGLKPSNLGNVAGLPARNTGPGLDRLEGLKRLEADGFEGIQLTTDAPVIAGSALPYCGADKINVAADADRLAKKHADHRDQCLFVLGRNTE